MSGRTRIAVVIPFIVLSVVARATAQVPTGSIIGAITDESKSVLPGVTATITSPALPGGPATVVTDEQGRYRFTGLLPGTYMLTLTLPGFATYQEEGLRVITGGTVERNPTLKLASVAETINVSGQSPMVDTRNVGVTTTSTVEVIENLPTIRGAVTDYMQAQPGVVAVNPGNYNERVQILGSPITETTYLHDGVMINHPARGDSFQGGDLDSVEEVQTTALGASAEYALAGGGVVNVVTKSGTNNFNGDATGFWKPNGLQSGPTVLNCNCPLGMTGFNLGPMADDSVHAGGPLIRDHLWYFGGFQYWLFNLQQPGTYPPEQPTSYWHRLPTKVTWQLNDTLKISQLLHLEW